MVTSLPWVWFLQVYLIFNSQNQAMLLLREMGDNQVHNLLHEIAKCGNLL